MLIVVAVIGWLNKQINEQQMMGGRVPVGVVGGVGGGGVGVGGSNSLPLSTIRHFSPLISTSAHSHHLVCTFLGGSNLLHNYVTSLIV